MDLKQYFRRIREVESSLTEQDPLIVSLGTSDGGKAGTISEVPRHIAAKMIVEGRAALASDMQIEEFRQQQANAKKAIERAEMSRRVQVAILSDSELQHNLVGRKGSGPSAGK
jgi:hypothetical protein